MHVLQYIAVQADNEDEAMRTVEDTLNHELGIDEYQGSAWYDWFVVGGGRFTEGDPYQSSTNNIISYKDKPDEYIQMTDRMVMNRMAEFRQYRSQFDLEKIDINAKLDSYDGRMDYSMDLYSLSKLIDMLQGKWNMDSYFYDLNNWSTNPKWVLDTLNDSWYLIPVDFHF